MISKGSFRAVLVALALFCALAPDADAAGPLMTYQGRLKESGVPVSGNRNIEVLFCSCISGLCCSSTGIQPVAVSSGLFRTTFTVPTDVNLAMPPWYLEIKVNASALNPREEVTASPYAVLAASATALSAISGTNGVMVSSNLFIVSGSSLGIGTTNPTLTLSLGNASARTLGVEDAGATPNPGMSLSIQSGAGGSAGGGSGGFLLLKSGAANSGNNNGGGIVLTPGDKIGTGIMGAVEISGGGAAAHLRATQTTAPGVAGFGSCGTGPVPTFAIGGTSTDMHGSITLNTGGGSPTPSCGMTVTFNRAYSGVPKAVLLTPASIDAGDVAVNGRPYIGVVSATSFSVNSGLAPSPGRFMTWYYVVIE